MTTEHFVIMNASSCTGASPSNITKGLKKLDADSGTFTVLVARRQYSWNKEKSIFISGSGHGYMPVPEAEVECVYTQDTGQGHRNQGASLFVENVIEITNGEVTNPGNGFGVEEKRTWWVMK